MRLGFDYKRLIPMFTVAFAFLLLYEYIFHSFLLKDLYLDTYQFWRTEADIKQKKPLYFCFVAFFAFVLTKLYIWSHENRPEEDNKASLIFGLRYGIYVGFLLALVHASSYIYMPIPLRLASAWAAGYFLEGIFLGLLLSVVYHLLEEEQKKAAKK